ncbi:hypothetical protein AUR64_12815 [Haloprofundus marisrubri]|uniref:Metallo-beta-lactamase domain-containing protein n=2 Tax=Haloprofundus marisrubri TaxID=1514971 RepID=A0A0W1RAM6_9EURY|nr:hypothetical protein AUR64_12815 [Haloprofundus marisrubri]
MKGGDEELREIDRWDHGVGWLAHPDEEMQRASHALELDGDVWVVDPVDADGVDDLLAEFGDVVGVVVGLDRHKRDAAALARRHDATVYVPDWMTGVAKKLNADVERFGRELGDTGVRALTIRDSTVPPWQEVGLYDENRGTLVVPEAVGTAAYFLADDERLGVHPMIRLFPPTRALSGLEPERILVGHGEGVHENASEALADALEHSRKRTPSLYGKTLKMMVSG